MAGDVSVVVQYIEVDHATLPELQALGRMGWQPAVLRWVEAELCSSYDPEDHGREHRDGYSGLLVRFERGGVSDGR